MKALPSELEICSAIARSGLFEADFYLDRNPDVAAAGIDPVLHYVRHGEAEMRNPAQFFDIALYEPLYKKGLNIFYQHILRINRLEARKWLGIPAEIHVGGPDE